MVQILEEGLPKKKTKAIFTLRCPYCGCKFTCEKEDFHTISKELNGLHYIECPWCGNDIAQRPSEMEITEIECNEKE